MAFIEQRLPEGIDYGYTGGETYSTDIIDIFSGEEQRNINWPAPRRKYTVSFSVKQQSDIDTLIAFFRAMKGKGNGFRFRDWTDMVAYAAPIATGDGNTTVFQLQKTYTAYAGALSDVSIIYKPVASGHQIATTVIMYLNGLPLVENMDYTVDYTTGLVTFVMPPNSGVAITADFEFDIPVRFDTDVMNRDNDYNMEYSWKSIPLIELRI
jgi:uncharacterized protein (TIGR02217 family)